METWSPPSTQQVAMVCELCAGGHATEQCAINSESALFVGSYNRSTQPYPTQNTYNLGWRNHPGFSWSNNQASTQAPRHQNTSEFQNQTQQQLERKSSWEEALEKFIRESDKRNEEQDKKLNQIELNMQSQGASIKNLKNQVGQIEHALNNRPRGTLPSDTDKNPGRDEYCKAVTL